MKNKKRIIVVFVTTLFVAVSLALIGFSETPTARARGNASPNVATPTVNPHVNAKYLDNLK